VTFVHGELYERSFETAGGTTIEVLAEIVVDGPRVELRDVAVYPRTAGRSSVSPAELLVWARLAVDEIRAAGFEELRVTGTRLSGATAGRRVDLVIRLKEDQR
jgi:hypothetical protein